MWPDETDGPESYRFSISWPRVLPEGAGKVNEAGVKFYQDLCDELLQNGIQPLVTLYHWDLPTALYRKGGWKNPEIVEWFAAYVEVISKALSGQVNYWITFNEPQMFCGLGLMAGVHAPFEHNGDAAHDGGDQEHPAGPWPGGAGPAEKLPRRQGRDGPHR